MLAASSLTDAFTGAQADLRRAHPHRIIRFEFAGSQVLARQVREGASADLIVTADTDTMDQLVAARRVGTPRPMARNGLVLIAAPGNPQHVTGPVDLSRPELRVVLADPSVPLGKYTRTLVDRLRLSVHPASLELDARSVLAKVTAGEADVAVVYATDGRAAGSRAAIVPLPPRDDVVATYMIGVSTRSSHPAEAHEFVTEAASGVVQRHLRQAGFRSPPGDRG